MWTAAQPRAVAMMTAIALASVITAMSAGCAEARLFEPQHNWWTAGRTCVGSRNPPGRRWQVLPPRSCVTARVTRAALDATPIADKVEFVEPKQPADAIFVAFATPKTELWQAADQSRTWAGRPRPTFRAGANEVRKRRAGRVRFRHTPHR